MKDFFKPLDFIYDDDLKFTANTAANLANEKLNKLIESWPVVYGTKDNNGQHFHENTNGNYNPTHTARLAFFEEIKKDCKHEPGGKLSKGSLEHVNRGGSVNDLKTFCKHCGTELVAEWREVK